MLSVISLGGSIIAPETAEGGFAVDGRFLEAFSALLERLLEEDAARRFIVVTGGGALARLYQKAYYGLSGAAGEKQAENADWIGIMATRLNAQLVKALFPRYCVQPVVTDPTAVDAFTGRVLVAAGWKPGFSSDNDTVLLARRFGSNTVINLSNIERVMSADPKKDPQAKALDSLSWEDFRRMIGDRWSPGANLPFDPVASREAAENGIKVICAAGRNLPNLADIIQGRPFIGTTIGA
jgi:uridylate kinase